MILTARKSRLLPCTPTAIMHIFDFYKIPLWGMKAVIIGRGMLVGYPLSILLIRRLVRVTILDETERDNLKEHI